MPRTPDKFPGKRVEEAIQFEADVVHPSTNGELRYVSGLGLRVFDEGAERGVGGISESDHSALATLTHDVVGSGVDIISYVGGRISNVTSWTDASKTQKVREVQLTYNTNRKVSQIVTIQYDAAGVEKERLTETLTYTDNKITGIARVKS